MPAARRADPKDQWRALIAALDLPPEDARNLMTVADQADPAHGLRAVFAANYGDVLRRTRPEAAPAYEGFCARLPRVPALSFMPLIEYAARFMRAAALFAPDAPKVDAVNLLSVVNARMMGDSPVMKAIVMAAEGDLLTLLLSFTQNNEVVFNFGSRELDVRKRGHVRTLYRDHYPLLCQYFLPGAARGTCAYLEVAGEVSFEQLSDGDFAIDIRW